MAIGRIKISICNVNFTYYFNIVFYIWHYAFEKNIIEYFGCGRKTQREDNALYLIALEQDAVYGTA